jgi:site-specific recombinase XerD
MLLKIRHTMVRVRRRNSEQFEGDEKFTGTVTYSVIGTVDGRFVRLALGTENERVAIRRVEKIKTACAVGPSSPLWCEIEDSLPVGTFKLFADLAGHVRSITQKSSPAQITWTNLVDVFEIEMSRLIANKKRGAAQEEGAMAESTRDRYRQTIRHFTAFLKEGETPLSEITASTLELFKAARVNAIGKLKQGRGGSSVALDIAILHRLFAFAAKKGLMSQNPIHLENESKPGKNPRNGARPFTAHELGKLRTVAGEDLFTFLLLRWTGLRGSDAISLQWQHIQFDRGVNGEIEMLTQKRSKTAIIPLSTELRNALEEVFEARFKSSKVNLVDFVLYNPDTKKPFRSRARLYERVKCLAERAGIGRATPHFFRDTFACDMLARGASIFDVAKMLADTVDTIEKHYASFVQAARDAAQLRMDNGIGIEERAKLAPGRSKVAVFRTSIAN